MQRVQVLVTRLRQYSAAAAFEVFGDLGSGVVDMAHPLPPSPIPLWPGAARMAGHLLDGHLTLRHLDGVTPDGHLESPHVLSEHLYPARAVLFDSPPYVFGRFVHAVRVIDGAGNTAAGTAPTTAVTINSAPRAPTRLARADYDGANDVLRFAFDPVRFDPVVGA